MYTRFEQQQMISLTRATLVEAWETGKILTIPTDLSSNLLEKYGAFVSLHDNHLRGCIGYLEAIYPLAETLQRCVISAAFTAAYDPLNSRQEVDEVDIEISVLSPLTPFSYTSLAELTENLARNKPGVTISDGNHHAVYLPLVWEAIPTVEDFLRELCLKAGMEADRWRNGDLKVATFTAEVFKESELQAQG